jgi:hypothetical protein
MIHQSLQPFDHLDVLAQQVVDDLVDLDVFALGLIRITGSETNTATLK